MDLDLPSFKVKKPGLYTMDFSAKNRRFKMHFKRERLLIMFTDRAPPSEKVPTLTHLENKDPNLDLKMKSGAKLLSKGSLLEDFSDPTQAKPEASGAPNDDPSKASHHSFWGQIKSAPPFLKHGLCFEECGEYLFLGEYYRGERVCLPSFGAKEDVPSRLTPFPAIQVLQGEQVLLRSPGYSELHCRDPLYLYEGEWGSWGGSKPQAGPEGIGRETRLSEDSSHLKTIYKGDFHQGRRHGFGELESENYTLRGQFKQGNVFGYCFFKVVLEETLEEYFGQLKGNKKQGFGQELIQPIQTNTFLETKKETYTGEFSNNFREGFGKCVYPDGSIYVGWWLEGKRSGIGLFSHEKIQYLGLWKEDTFQPPDWLIDFSEILSNELSLFPGGDSDNSNKPLIIDCPDDFFDISRKKYQLIEQTLQREKRFVESELNFIRENCDIFVGDTQEGAKYRSSEPGFSQQYTGRRKRDPNIQTDGFFARKKNLIKGVKNVHKKVFNMVGKMYHRTDEILFDDKNDVENAGCYFDAITNEYEKALYLLDSRLQQLPDDKFGVNYWELQGQPFEMVSKDILSSPYDLQNPDSEDESSNSKPESQIKKTVELLDKYGGSSSKKKPLEARSYIRSANKQPTKKAIKKSVYESLVTSPGKAPIKNDGFSNEEVAKFSPLAADFSPKQEVFQSEGLNQSPTINPPISSPSEEPKIEEKDSKVFVEDQEKEKFELAEEKMNNLPSPRFSIIEEPPVLRDRLRSLTSQKSSITQKSQPPLETKISRTGSYHSRKLDVSLTPSQILNLEDDEEDRKLKKGITDDQFKSEDEDLKTPQMTKSAKEANSDQNGVESRSNGSPEDYFGSEDKKTKSCQNKSVSELGDPAKPKKDNDSDDDYFDK